MSSSLSYSDANYASAEYSVQVIYLLFCVFIVACDCLLQELGVLGSFTKVDEFSLEMIPFDSDLLSMEMEDSFRVHSLFSLSADYNVAFAAIAVAISYWAHSMGP